MATPIFLRNYHEPSVLLTCCPVRDLTSNTWNIMYSGWTTDSLEKPLFQDETSFPPCLTYCSLDLEAVSDSITNPQKHTLTRLTRLGGPLRLSHSSMMLVWTNYVILDVVCRNLIHWKPKMERQSGMSSGNFTGAPSAL